MKFSLKLLLWTLVVMAIGLGFSGYYFVNHVFQTSIDREALQALDENSILRFALETAALNVPAKYDVLQDGTVEQIGYSLEHGGTSSRLLRISDEDKQILYASTGFAADQNLLTEGDGSVKAWQITDLAGRKFIQTATQVDALDRLLYLETMRDVTGVFEERTAGFSLYRRVTVAILAAAAVIMYVISSWLTRPIRLLTRATRRMAYGDYDYRARKISNDELGQLTDDFNKMAGSLEDSFHTLEEEIRSREDFMAAFAHELKTPLTAIIGYADMLRSRRLNEEKSFMSANYIYSEGKRLETMSFRLLDIIVARRHEMKFRQVAAKSLIYGLYELYAYVSEMKITFTYDNAMIRMEPDLIKSVLINLLDNACKASSPGDTIALRGRVETGGYRFTVQDYGMGIPREEQHKITKAFYMVDKSRSRSRNGAGLGLALCAEILALHESRLEIESEQGQGTTMSFLLPNEAATVEGEA